MFSNFEFDEWLNDLIKQFSPFAEVNKLPYRCIRSLSSRFEAYEHYPDNLKNFASFREQFRDSIHAAQLHFESQKNIFNNRCAWILMQDPSIPKWINKLTNTITLLERTLINIDELHRLEVELLEPTLAETGPDVLTPRNPQQHG